MRRGRWSRVFALAAALALAGPAAAQVFVYRGMVPSAKGWGSTPVELMLEPQPNGRLSGNVFAPDLLGRRTVAIRGINGRQCVLLFGNVVSFEGSCSERALVGRWREGDGKPVQVRFAGGGPGLGGDPAYDSNARTAARLVCNIPASPLLASPETARAAEQVAAFAAGDGAPLKTHAKLFNDMAIARSRLDYSGAELEQILNAMLNPAGGGIPAVRARLDQEPSRREALALAQSSHAEIQRLFGNWFERAVVSQTATREAILASDAAMAARISALPEDRAGAEALVAALGRAIPDDWCAVRPAPALTQALQARAARFGPALTEALAARGTMRKEDWAVRQYADKLRQTGLLAGSPAGMAGIARVEAEAAGRRDQQRALAQAAEQKKADAAMAQAEAARKRGPLDVDLTAAYTNAFWDAHGPQKKYLVDSGILKKGSDFVMLDLMGQAAAQWGTTPFFNYKEVWSFAATDVRCTPKSATVSQCTYKVGWEIDVEQPGSNILKAVGMGNLDRSVRSQLNDAMGQPLKEVTDTFTRTASGWASPAIGKRMAFLYGRAESMRGALSRSGAGKPANPKTGTDICKSLAAGVLAGGGDMSGPAGRMYEGAGC